MNQAQWLRRNTRDGQTWKFCLGFQGSAQAYRYRPVSKLWSHSIADSRILEDAARFNDVRR